MFAAIFGAVQSEYQSSDNKDGASQSRVYGRGRHLV